jgi:hypothetical protein
VDFAFQLDRMGQKTYISTQQVRLNSSHPSSITIFLACAEKHSSLDIFSSRCKALRQTYANLEMAAQSFSMLANNCIGFISVARILAGSSTLFTPQLAGQLFGLPINLETYVIARLFGVRDMIIGAYLWSARGHVSQAIARGDAAKIMQARRDVKNMLWMGMICDSVDVCSFAVAVLAEGMEGRAIGLVGGGAAAFAALAGVALRRP